MASRRSLIPALALIGLLGCARTEESAPAATTVRSMELAEPGISVATDTYVLARGGPMTEIAPLNTGGRIKDCSISPALPTGLVLDKKYCVISGAPTGLQDQVTYTVVAANQYGTSSLELKIKVGQGILEGLFDTLFSGAGFASAEPVGATPSLRAMIPQSDGKILLGYSNATGHKWLRLNADGTKDSASLNLLGSSCFLILSEACELGAATGLASGRTLVGYVGLTYNQLRIVRYLADGTRDTAFGTSGVTTLASPAATAVPEKMRVLADGKILVLVQLASSTAVSGAAPALVRLNANGSIDNGFGTGGVAFVAGLHHANSLDADAVTGKIFVGGAVAALPADEALVILGADGSAVAGPVTLAIGANDPHDLAFDASARKLLVVTSSASGGTHLARYNVDGALDAAFGAGGQVVRFLGADNVVRRVKVDRWGNIFVLGNEGFGTGSFFTVAAFDSAGAPLAGFAGAGLVRGLDPTAHLMAVAEFSAGGSLIIAGTSAANAAVAVLK